MIEEVNKEETYKPNQKMETQHFIIVYNEIDNACIGKVSDVLEGSYSEITNKLKQQLEEKLIVEIYTDLNQLHTALGLTDAPDWIRGGLADGKIIIASPLNPPLGSTFDNVVKTAVHEFVHILTKKINSNIPRWLDEGIACYEAKDNNEKWIISTLRKGLENNTIPLFDDLDTREDFQTFFEKDGYQYSYTIVETIVNVFGYDKLHSLVKSPGKFVDVFGITKHELQNEWVEYIKNNYL
ncbi:hypothetical protein EDC18_103329 [Natranaerovirga pectinivora]|uniref:Peptidase MA-like domain-containing protein n=1 Tax=Natranaerovirga pectinivora TaxID=682400 RepID=A0A4R3MR25_9FIRM|nr:hypothetical protein [Natranaerovirga pectinivora]TCT15621.1 hypothetical protein EDC18_103329 [Natranaerovirga pectinivora]